MPPNRIRGLLCGLLLAPLVVTAAGIEVADAGRDLTELSLEELLNIDVTSVSKHAEPLASAAAAIYVLTGDDIRRSGARNIAEALRLVPGMDVARSNAYNYAVSARGFEHSHDKLQVLIDGRSVYTPLTSDVFWDALDTYLPDIDRIEVIRGPGAALWGANAVNGVVNIVTRSAADTRKGDATVGVGKELRGLAQLRQGFRVGDSADARVYLKAFQQDNALRPDGSVARDGNREVQGGFRGDWRASERQSLSLSADAYVSHEHNLGASSHRPVENGLNGANIGGRWNLATGARGNLTANFSYDWYRHSIPEAFNERRGTYDLGVQHATWIGARNEVVYGLGYRSTHDRTGGPPLALIFQPPSRTLRTYSAFAQDQVHFDGGLTWTLGTKFEHNDFTGYEWQPGTRLGWQISPAWFTWTAVSRALRTPNRLDSDVAIFCPPPVGLPGTCGPNTIISIGNPQMKSEKVLAYEWGGRFLGGRSWSADLALFYNRYHDLISVERVPPFFFRIDNKISGHGAGGELALDWRPRPDLEIKPSYSFVQLGARRDADSTDTGTDRSITGGSPRHQAGLLVLWQPVHAVSLAGFARYVDRLRQVQTASATGGSPEVPDYAELNLRATWRPWRSLELGLSGENLLHARHPEYGLAAQRSELQRSFLVDASWAW